MGLIKAADKWRHTQSAGDALSPNSNFNGLIFGVRGFCIKAFCTTYSDYRRCSDLEASSLLVNRDIMSVQVVTQKGWEERLDSISGERKQ